MSLFGCRSSQVGPNKSPSTYNSHMIFPFGCISPVQSLKPFGINLGIWVFSPKFSSDRTEFFRYTWTSALDFLRSCWMFPSSCRINCSSVSAGSDITKSKIKKIFTIWLYEPFTFSNKWPMKCYFYFVDSIDWLELSQKSTKVSWSRLVRSFIVLLALRRLYWRLF